MASVLGLVVMAQAIYILHIWALGSLGICLALLSDLDWSLWGSSNTPQAYELLETPLGVHTGSIEQTSSIPLRVPDMHGET